MFTISKLENNCYQLNGELIYDTVEGAHNLLSKLLEINSTHITIKLNGLKQIDIAGIQILLSFQKTLGKDKLKFEPLSKELNSKLTVVNILI